VIMPACTCDMSVLDVFVHTVGARAAKIRLAKMKECANDTAATLCAFDPFEDESRSHEDQSTREVEEKEEDELQFVGGNGGGRFVLNLRTVG